VLLFSAKAEEIRDLKVGEIGGQIAQAEQWQLPGVHGGTIANGRSCAKNVQIAGSI